MPDNVDNAEYDRLPLPPSERPADAGEGEVLVQERLVSWRLHEADQSPLSVPFHPFGRGRFDAPAGEYRHSYTNRNRLGAFGEYYGDDRRINPEESERRVLWRMESTEPLQFVALDDAGVQKCFDLDARICTAKQYRITREWALAFFNWYPYVCGIRYIARHASPHLSYCLFLDRCPEQLLVEREGQLKDLRNTVRLASRQYKLRWRI